MNWVITKNNRCVGLKEIPRIPIDDLRPEIVGYSNSGKRVVSFFGAKNNDSITIYIVMADDENSQLYVSSAHLNKEKQYRSITQDAPCFHMFERELYEDFGILPVGHPWLKPVRYSFNRFNSSQKIENYPFFIMEGEEVHEVAVGPIHAGIIEPGHFRFMCHGENIYHLEIQLGFQHRGVEAFFVESKDLTKLHNLAESIAGDSVIANVTAYANAVESLAGMEVSVKTKVIRSIAMEMERLATHIGDLGAIANDIAYLPGSAVYGSIRTLVINALLGVCGSRFGRGFIRAGGVNYDLDAELKEEIKNVLNKVNKDVELMSETMFSQASVLGRLEKTGVIERETALQIGMVGPAARASGISIDVRADHPYCAYMYSPIHKISLPDGDVFARAYMRYIEIKKSIRFILEQLDNFPEDDSLMREVGRIAPLSFVVSMVEGWRGELVHAAITDKNGRFSRYKIKDPSFNNWFGLALGVRNNGISDFPLCNKSFNLSYCGNDL